VTEGAAYGAALLAAVGVGAFASVEAACAAVIRTTGTVAPGVARETYERSYARYRALYPALADRFRD
jgi:xylulokinase